MTENATEPTESTEAQQEVDPDVEAALQDENEILANQMEQFKSQHFQNRLIAIGAVNRKLQRENNRLKARIAELESND